MWLPSGSASTAHQLVGVISDLGTTTAPPFAVACSRAASIESTSTMLRGCVKPSARSVSAPPETPLGAWNMG